MEGRNVLYLAHDAAVIAQETGRELPGRLAETAEIERRLLAARNRRPAVPVDDKIITAWNGYMLTTLALAGRLLDEPRYLQAAEDAAAFLLRELYDEKTGTVYRDVRQGKRGVPGFSTDYASLAEALLTLYRVTGERRWLLTARVLVDGLLAQFWDSQAGGFYLTAGDSGFWLREKPASDGASLAVNGIATHVLLDLARFTGDPVYRDRARQTAAWLEAQHADHPAAFPYALIRWRELLQSAETGNDLPPDDDTAGRD
jgi:uncharacterized protein YyaL (SSP411 family)